MTRFFLLAAAATLFSSCYLAHEARSICRVTSLYEVDDAEASPLVPSGSVLVLGDRIYFGGTRGPVAGVFRVDDAGRISDVGIVAGSAVGHGLASIDAQIYFAVESPMWMLASVPNDGGTTVPRFAWGDSLVSDGMRLYGRLGDAPSVSFFDPTFASGSVFPISNLTAIAGTNGRFVLATSVAAGDGRVESMNGDPATSTRTTLGVVSATVSAIAGAPEGVLVLARGGIVVMPLDGRGARVAANGLVDAERIVSAAPGRALVASPSRWTRVELASGHATEVLSETPIFGWDADSEFDVSGDAVYFATRRGVFRADGCFD